MLVVQVRCYLEYYMEILKIFLPELFLFFCILSQLLISVNYLRTFKNLTPCLNNEFFIQGFFLFFCVFILNFNQKFVGYSFNLLFIFDESSIFLKIFLSFIINISFVVVWRAFVNQKINFFEYYIILFLAVFGLFLLINACDLISIYLILELQALCFYILAAYKRNSSFSTESGLKYFILGSFVSGLFLLGCFLLYSTLGTTNFQNISLILSFPLDSSGMEFLVLLGVFLILVTFFFKIIVIPFHSWAPDVYEGAPLASTIFFSLIPKISLITIFFRFLSIFLPLFEIFSNLLFFLGIFSIFGGAYLALSQKRIKRFLLYSSISQIGFLILGMSQYKIDAISSVYFYLFIYLISSIVIWGFLTNFYNVNIKSSLRTSIYNFKPVLLVDISSYFRSNISWSVTILVIFFSFAGIPPFTGFLSKILILFNIIKDCQYFLLSILVLISVVSGYYYLRVIKIIFFEKFQRLSLVKKQNFWSVSFMDFEYTVYSFCIFLVIFVFFFPSFFILISNYLVLDFF